MIRVAIAGYGNIGKYAVEAVREAPDMELAGVIRRKSSAGETPDELAGVTIASDVRELGKVDVALLCVPTRNIPETAEHYLSLGIHTVDSFDIHGDALWRLRSQLDTTAKKHNAVAILSAGWDPGSNSVIRAIMEALAPKGMTHTNFGPGMSMGHTVAVKSMKGVRNALSMTIPKGEGVHHRMVYIELEPGADLANVEQAIKTDAYFANDHTTVTQVDNVDALIDMGHGVEMKRKGVSSATHNQLLEFRMKINNPAVTAQVMCACGRAAMRQRPGAYVMPEIPPLDLLHGNREELIKKLV